MIIVRNFTPHPVTLLGKEGVYKDSNDGKLRVNSREMKVLRVYNQVGLARCSSKEVELEDVDGLPTVTLEWGEVYGLPEYQPNVYYIVSAIVFNALPNRKDLLCPTSTVLNELKKTAGCLKFSRHI